MADVLDITGSPPALIVGAVNPLVIGALDYRGPSTVHPDGTPAVDYCAAAIDRLLQEFKGKPKLEGLICAVANRGTELEQEVINVKEFRSLDTALGQQLDELGTMYGELRGGLDDDDYRARLKAMALVVASKGTPNEMIDVLVTLDDGFALASIEYISHPPACFIMTALVPLGGQLLGETFARILKRMVPAGVCFQLMFEEQGETLFVWEGDTGEGFAEEDDLAGTGGVWAEAV